MASLRTVGWTPCLLFPFCPFPSAAASTFCFILPVLILVLPSKIAIPMDLQLPTKDPFEDLFRQDQTWTESSVQPRPAARGQQQG